MEGGKSNSDHEHSVVQEISKMHRTGFPIGGCLFLLMFIYICWYFVGLIILYIRKEPSSFTTFTSSLIDDQSMLENPLNMTIFEDSFNVIFGVNNLEKGFNLLDNDYFRIKAFTLEGGTIDKSAEIKLKMCS